MAFSWPLLRSRPLSSAPSGVPAPASESSSEAAGARGHSGGPAGDRSGQASGLVQRLLEPGSIHPSPGGQYSFRVIGPCCRLFDREELPWPCCRLAWRSKEPSWRRIGRRFVADLASRRCPSYVVELLQPGSRPTTTVITLFPQRLSAELQEWWYSKRLNETGAVDPEQPPREQKTADS